MNPITIYCKSLTYHWRTNVAVMLCVLVGSAALTGALLVGDSMRGSLRELALRRLGPVDYALAATRFFRKSLAENIGAGEGFSEVFQDICPAIILEGGIHHAESKTRVNRIHVYGVDRRFWGLDPEGPKPGMADGSRTIVLNRKLADELGAKAGDDVIVRLPRPSLIPTETLLGRPDQIATSLRLTVAEIVPDDGLGGFGLKPEQAAPRNAFVPLRTMQRAIGQDDRINGLLAKGTTPGEDQGEYTERRGPNELLGRHVRLEDFDLRLRLDERRGYFALETDRLLLEPPVEATAVEVAGSLGLKAKPNLTYLANSIALVDKRDPNRITRAIPYSTVTAIPSPPGADFGIADPGSSGIGASALGDEQILLNRWAADDLGVSIGDTIRIEYYVSRRFGGLDTKTTSLALAGILPMDSPTADPGFMPAYEGISQATSIADWDPPPSFKIDLGRIRDGDEAYWDKYKGTPKAFISLKTGQGLWTEANSRFGKLTAIHFTPGSQSDVESAMAAFEQALLKKLRPGQLGLAFEPVKQQALAAGAGSTDFSQLFLAFSFFLIVAAALLVALVFRLSIERRAGEIGILLATGHSAKQVTRRFLLEGAIVADVGSALGLLGALGYAWLMLAGLRSWWSDAVNAPFLNLHVSLLSLAIGYVGSFAIAMASIAWSMRGLTRMSPRALLAGAVQSGRGDLTRRGGRTARFTLPTAVLISVGLLAFAFISAAAPLVFLFFGSGAAILVAGLSAMSLWMGRENPGLIRSFGVRAMLQLGARNATRHRGRSLTTAALIACASFVIVAVGASRQRVGEDALAKDGGTGGYALMAESVVPLQYDLNTQAGRDELNITRPTANRLDDATVMALRLQPGDDASCLNLYQVVRPRILGAPEAMIRRGGFSFQQSMAESPEEKDNPWLLLNRRFPDGAVPAVGDANTLMWLLKRGIGDDFEITDERGQPGKLRIVGMLAGSVLQGELVIADHRFKQLFPSTSGYGLALIELHEAPDSAASSLAHALEHDLSDFGFDAESTLDKLNEYRAVENTYMSTFQTLGGLGLVLGTLGLAAVMLRNVLERRGELALLRALGHRQASLGWMVFSENAVLLIAGLLIGGLSALLAVAPHAATQPGQIPWGSLGLTLLLVFVTGMLASAAALASALRTPLLPALRGE